MLNIPVWLLSLGEFLVLSVRPTNKCCACARVCVQLCVKAMGSGILRDVSSEQCGGFLWHAAQQRFLPRCMEQLTTQLFKQSMWQYTSASPTSLLKSN